MRCFTKWWSWDFSAKNVFNDTRWVLISNHRGSVEKTKQFCFTIFDGFHRAFLDRQINHSLVGMPLSITRSTFERNLKFHNSKETTMSFSIVFNFKKIVFLQLFHKIVFGNPWRNLRPGSIKFHILSKL